MASAQDVYETTTAAIVRAIEEGAGTWRMPWTAEGLAFPSNPTTGKRYRGGNVLTLWLSALQQGYTLGEWATYKQWKSIGAQVRKGEKGTGALFFARRESDETAEEEGTRARFIANRFVVFNAAQVEGYTPRIAKRDTVEQIERAEQFFAAVGATVEHRNEGRAYYRPSDDLIVLPPFETFTDAPSYYATSAHEHAHWTGQGPALR